MNRMNRMKLLDKIQRLLGVVTLLLLVVGIGLVETAPPDYQQGGAVRILYVHVPSAKMALLVYLFLTVISALYLWRRTETLDILAEAAVPVGAAFSVITLASGSIWGKPMWGAWWAWDARLTSMLVLLILYMGLMALRRAMDDPVKGARASAVLAIVGAVDLPIVHYSVTWWRALHQPPSLDGPAKQAITGDLLPPLLVMSAAFLCMGGYMLLLKSQEVAAQRRLDIMEASRLEHTL